VAVLKEELNDINERVGVGEVAGDKVRPEGLRRDGVRDAITERETMLLHGAELFLQAFEELHLLRQPPKPALVSRSYCGMPG